MKTLVLHVALLFFALLFFNSKSTAQVYASSQNFTANWLCESCSVVNPDYSVDSDFSSSATIIQTASSFGSEIYLNIIFSTQAKKGEIVGVIVEDLDFKALDTSLLSSVILTTYNGNTSNMDSRKSTDFNFYPLPNSTSKYILEFEASNTFNALRFAMKGVNEGALNKIKVYYAYYGSEPVPIVMNFFKADQNNSKVKLEWQTASEFNNDYFVIERSHNAIDFQEIAIVQGQGNSLNAVNYSFEDNNPLKGTAYYRLKQIDFDQKFKYFDILPVTFTDKDFHFDIYPNPLQGTDLNLSYSNTEGAFIEIRNMAGEKVFYSSPLEDAARFENTFKLNAKLKSGIYFVILTNNNNTYIKKLIVV